MSKWVYVGSGYDDNLCYKMVIRNPKLEVAIDIRHKSSDSHKNIKKVAEELLEILNK